MINVITVSGKEMYSVEVRVLLLYAALKKIKTMNFVKLNLIKIWTTTLKRK